MGASRIGADAQASALEMQNRTAAGGDRMDMHHRCAHAHTRDLGVEAAFNFSQIATGKMRYVG